jgi:peroxiredoxin Q/BCP
VKRFTCFFAAACATLALAALSDSTLRGSPMDPPKVGDPAPAFEAKDDQGKIWKSADHFGKKIVVVYFYPADFTGGCTKQACSFRDDAKPLTDKGVEVVGVSGDSVGTHAEFKKAHKLEFTLLSDESGALADKFGVPFTKKEGTAKYEGRIFVRGGTSSRHTVIVGTDGKVAASYDVKDAGGDSKKVLEIVGKTK